ncbi:hypothetical protein L7F22_011639 [Adiantum nelumboides]|nr:hypothetical protein [Adiantum nelumboides]
MAIAPKFEEQLSVTEAALDGRKKLLLDECLACHKGPHFERAFHDHGDSRQIADEKVCASQSLICLAFCFSDVDQASLGCLSSLCMQGQMKEALQSAEDSYVENLFIPKDRFYALLQECCRSKDLAAGRQVFSLMVKCQVETSAFLGYHLMYLFSSCGKMDEAYKLFNMILNPNGHTFHAIVLACARAGASKKIFELFDRMLEVGVTPDKFIFSSMLHFCVNLGGIEKGKLIHDQIIRWGLQSHLILGNTLIDMYSKCRYLDEARRVFDKMPIKDVVSWGSLIGGFAQHGNFTFAFATFEKMKIEGVNPSNVTFLCILKQCSCRSALEEVRWVHLEIIKTGNEQDLRIGSALVGVYSNCRQLDEARQVFESLANPDAIAWGAIITGYSQHGPAAAALDMFYSLKLKKIKPDVTCFSSTLNACGKLGMLERGKLVHGELLERRLEHIAVVGGALVDMYTHCGSLADAQNVFEGCPSKDVVSYGAMISGYVQNGQSILALHAYAEMELYIAGPSKFVFSSVLKACGILGALKEGAYIYDRAVRTAVETDVVVGSAIVDMYAKCASIMEGCKVFMNLHKKDLVTWGAMIVGLVQYGDGYQAYALFKKMLQEGFEPDTYVFTGTLKACGMMGALKEGMLLHALIAETDCESDTAVGSALVDMYVKCRSINDSMWLFRKLPSRNMEAWGAIIAGCLQFGHGFDALDLFSKMLYDLFEPDTFIFLVIFKACGSIGAEMEGRLAHGLVMECGLASEASIGNSLVDMYCRCGRVEDARCEFDILKYPDASSWNSMVTGYCLYDQWVSALELFESMDENAHKPSKTTLLSLLKACANVGAIRQGTLIHGMIIRRRYELDALLGSTLLEMYANCGNLREAQKVFDSLSNQDVVAWGALIAGYALHGNYKMVGQCFKTFCSGGLQPNNFMFTNILAACSHSGFLEGATFYFKCMVDDYGMLPNIEQYSCMIDLFGQMGCLSEMDDMVQTMAMIPDFVMCTSLLNSCQRYGSVGLGRLRFKQLVKLAPSDASGYRIISSLYADVGSWDTDDMIVDSYDAHNMDNC